MPDYEAEFGLRPLQLDDSFGSMKSGGEAFRPLTSFARKKAKTFEKANLARTYVMVDKSVPRIAAYITLVCSEVRSPNELINEAGLEFNHDHYPAVKIARLLVDERYRGENRRGIGRTLVDFALGTARTEICPAVGCRFVVVDSKKESVDFYKRCGFTLIDTPENLGREQPVMFIDLHRAAA